MRKQTKTITFPEMEIVGKKYSSITVRLPSYNEKYTPQKNWPSKGPTAAEMIDYQVQLGSTLCGIPHEVFNGLPAYVAEEAIAFFME